MSITRQEAEFEQGMDELYKEFKKQFKDEFIFDQVHSYYKENPDVAREPLQRFQESKLLFSQRFYTSTFLFAVISIEVGIKLIVLKPILYSLAFSTAAGELLYDTTFKLKSIPQIPDLYFHILRDTTGIDLKDIQRTTGNKKLWDEISNLQKLRNEVLHQARTIIQQESEQSINIAESLYNEIIPKVLDEFSFHLKDGKISYGTLRYLEAIARFETKSKSENI